MNIKQTAKQCFLYRHFDKNNILLYVGISLNTIYRLSQHKNHSEWFYNIQNVTIESFESRGKALNAERNAIKNEKPKHNIIHNSKKGNNQTDFEETLRSLREEQLTNNIVHMKSMYNADELERELGVSRGQVKKLWDTGKLGYVILSVNSRGYPKRLTTGWQLIEYIEAMEADIVQKIRKEKESLIEFNNRKLKEEILKKEHEISELKKEIIKSA